MPPPDGLGHDLEAKRNNRERERLSPTGIYFKINRNYFTLRGKPLKLLGELLLQVVAAEVAAFWLVADGVLTLH